MNHKAVEVIRACIDSRNVSFDSIVKNTKNVYSEGTDNKKYEIIIKHVTIESIEAYTDNKIQKCLF